MKRSRITSYIHILNPHIFLDYFDLKHDDEFHVFNVVVFIEINSFGKFTSSANDVN